MNDWTLVNIFVAATMNFFLSIIHGYKTSVLLVKELMTARKKDVGIRANGQNLL